MFERIAEAMKFPGYFEKNWDSFDECLLDLEWLHETRHVLLVEHCGDFWRKSPVSVGRLIKTWLFCAQQWSQQGIPFHLILALDD